MDALVSVIIPVYNAAQTLDETLESVRGQTHRALEIIVVNDGSSDASQAIAERHQRTDPRIIICAQTNKGVASARNTGLQAASGRYVAFLDADDLWHSTKIAKQVRALETAPLGTAAVYCWTRVIDSQGLIINTLAGMTAQNFILRQHVYENVTGNGSCLLVLRSAALKVGGFDDELRVQGFQGADDLLFQLKLAMTYGYVLVPEYLVGYRRLGSTVSTNKRRMFGSVMLSLDFLKRETQAVPDFVFRWSRAAFLFDLIGYYVRLWRPLSALQTGLLAAWLDPEMVWDRITGWVTRSVQPSNAMSAIKGEPFYAVSPSTDIRPDQGLHARRMQALAYLDEHCAHKGLLATYSQAMGF